MFVFFSHIQLQSLPMQNGLIGLNTEAIGKKQWGIATDRFKKTENPRTWLLVPAPWVNSINCHLLSTGCYPGQLNSGFLTYIYKILCFPGQLKVYSILDSSISCYPGYQKHLLSWIAKCFYYPGQLNFLQSRISKTFAILDS